MLLIKLLVNEKVMNAEFALNQASSDTVVDRCQTYLSLLIEYRNELYKFRDAQELNLKPSSLLLKELIEQTSKVIQAEEENTNRKRDQAEALLKSFTSITGYEAVQTFNRLEFKGSDEWELRADEVRLKDDANGEKFTVQEAIEIAGKLRRKAYVIYKTTF